MKYLILLAALMCGGVLTSGNPARSDEARGGAAATADAAPAGASWSIASVSAMHKLTATAPGVFEPCPKDVANTADLYGAGGEWVNTQVVVTAGDAPLRNVRIVPVSRPGEPNARPLGGEVFVFHERFIQVTQPSGNRRLEKLWWADPLVPQDWQQVDVPAHRSAAFWVSIHVDENAVRAPLFGDLQVSTSEGSKNLSVGIAILKTKVPAPTMRATAALYYDVLHDWYSKNIGAQSDAEWAATKRAYYDFLLDYRINGYDLPVGPEDAAFGDYARSPKVTAIRTPPLGTPEFEPFLAALDATGARAKAFYYRHDEPQPEQYAAIIADGQKLHAAGVKQLVTTAPNAKLLKAVEIWCLNNGDALGLGHLDLDALARARKRGEETWWYTMTVPRAPYPTWLLDDDASSVRLYGWQMARWGINGFVYSMVHGWGPKPLEDLKSFAGSNGDGTLLYPGEMAGGHGPMPSIRLMLLRDAIEDYELLQTLPEKQRLSVLSYAVGASPAERRDTYNDWADERYRDRYVRSTMGQPVVPAPAVTVPVARLPIGTATTPHAADGLFAPGEWPAGTQIKTIFQRFENDTLPPSENTLYLRQRAGHLLVGLRTEDAGPAEWCAVELAPEDASERWRFVVTAGGKTAVERHTREGHFRIEGAEWKGAARAESGGKGFTYEWSIPLDLVADAGTLFRVNVLRRVDDVGRDAKYTVRAWADAGDVTRMPFARRAGEPARKNAVPRKRALSK